MQTDPPIRGSGEAVEALPYGIPPSGYRLPAAVSPGVVHLQVANLARSLAFYQDVLGFRVIEHTGHRIRLAAHGEDVPLLELTEHAGARSWPRRGRLGLFHFAVLLPDRTALGRLLVHLGRMGVRPGMSDHLVSEALYLQDPDGLGLEIYADRPRAGWLHEKRELAMDTKPLGVEDLIRASHNEPWSGMPPGTVIGHLHLHVGDLKTAASFYHDALGLDVVVWSYPGALFLSAGGYHHHLGLNTWAGPEAGRPEPGDARLLAWTLVLPGAEDVESAVRSLEGAGYPVDRKPGESRVQDPWGTTLRLTSAGARLF